MKTLKFRSLSLLALGATLCTAGLLTVARADTPAAAPADAPAAKEKGKRGERQQPKWLEELNLTDAQKEQIKPIMKDSMEKRKAIRDDATLTADQRKEKSKALRDEQMEKIKAILTDEQKKKLADAMAKGREGRRDKKDAPAAAPKA